MKQQRKIKTDDEIMKVVLLPILSMTNPRIGLATAEIT